MFKYLDPQGLLGCGACRLGVSELGEDVRLVM